MTVTPNGKEAVAAWRTRCENGSHIRIVALTAHAMAGDRERCVAAGMDDYLAKPIDKNDLLQVLGQLATRS